MSLTRCLVLVYQARIHIKYVVVDTLNGIMIGDEMRRVKEKGYTGLTLQCFRYRQQFQQIP